MDSCSFTFDPSAAGMSGAGDAGGTGSPGGGGDTGAGTEGVDGDGASAGDAGDDGSKAGSPDAEAAGGGEGSDGEGGDGEGDDGEGAAVAAVEAGHDVDGEWACPREAHPGADRCVFHMDADRRAELGVDAATVTDRLVGLVEDGDADRKRLLGADLPRVELSYRHLSGTGRHPIDLRGADVDGLVFDHATVDPLVDLRGATVGELHLDGAVFRTGLSLSGATVTGEFDAVESEFDHDFLAAGTAFEGPARFEETAVEDDADFEGATFGAAASFAGAEFHGRSNARDDNVDFAGVTFEEEVTFRGASFEYATFEGGTFEGGADFEESAFDGEVLFGDAAFGAHADFDEVRFADDALFGGATFAGEAQFRGAVFEGGPSTLQDDADFREATFEASASFEQGAFGSADLRGATFRAEADFQEATFEDDLSADGATFGGLADFDEVRFRDDAAFEAATFEGTADFRGAEFEGGANTLDKDADFADATFEGPAAFDRAVVGYADFGRTTFEEEAVFQSVAFEEDVDFPGATFRKLADFDEARFGGDGDFSEATFEGRADFRGVEFLGEARHLEENARFAEATFRGEARFDDAVFNTANFEGTRLAEGANFRNVRFLERVRFGARSLGETAYVDMTDAVLAEGSIAQPEDHWVRYDLTRATVGELHLSGDTGRFELLDYFRFVETDFDGFDFSEHRGYFDRNDWVLHDFEEADLDYEVAVPATPEAVETTYLYAYNNARATGDGDAAIEFAIKQARARRRKNLAYVRDGSLDAGYRLRKVGDVVGNTLWYLSCGYGYRLGRIVGLSLSVVLTWGLLYALPIPGTETSAGTVGSVGELLSAGGVTTLWRNVYYSFITFTTVGYGNVGPAPEADLTRLLAASEGVLGVLLAALVVFVLGRRVAV